MPQTPPTAPASIRFVPSSTDALSPDSPRCSHCGEPAFLDISEIWPDDRALLPETCCETRYHLVVDEMQEWPREVWRAFLADRAGLDIRHVITGGATQGQWLIDWGLRVGHIPLREAKAFVKTHHRHNKPPAGWRFGAGVWNGQDLVGVMMAGRPVARKLDHTQIVEVNRLCINPTLEPGLVWNACSMLYAHAARTAEAKGFSRIITYTLHTEAGTSVKAAGYLAVHQTRGGSWDRKRRRRRDQAPTIPKIRWERILRPATRRGTPPSPGPAMAHHAPVGPTLHLQLELQTPDGMTAC